MNRQQLSLVVLLTLLGSASAFAAGPNGQTTGWNASAENHSLSTLSGKLYRNAADQSGTTPYLLLDRWGVVRGYVAAAQGVDLDASVGQQVTLQGTLRNLPGGEMPVMTCEKVLGSSAEPAKTGPPANAEPQTADNATRTGESPWRDVTPAATSREPLPLREVVLQARPIASSDHGRRTQLASERRSDPRRRNAAVRPTNYDESIPAPAPTGPARSPQPLAEPSIEPVPMTAGPIVDEGSMLGPGGPGCDSCDDGVCDTGCNRPWGEACWGPRGPLFCWGPTGIWVKADYLHWWQNGTRVPPLVTTGPTTAQPGYYGENGTRVLFGDESINNDGRGGGRIQAGLWLNRCLTFGIEGEYLGLADENTEYRLWSDGNPIVSRPFYDVGRTTPVENIEKVAYPRGANGSLDGAIDISATTQFYGTGARFLFTTCRSEGCWSDDCGSCRTFHDRYRAIFAVGYRYLYLSDQLDITENLTSTQPEPLDPNDPTGAQGVSAFLVNDRFSTRNSFSGADLGMKFEFQRNRWSLDLFPRIAFGSTHEVVDISGATRTTSPAGVQNTVSGGLLALPTTNIGHYTKDSFAVVPELDVNVGFQFTNHTRVVFGYSLLYWSKVARVGEQIDRTVNSTLLPNSNADLAGDLTRPRFQFQESSFWAQGINVGLDCRW